MGFIEILNHKKNYGLKMAEKSEKRDQNLKIGIEKNQNKIINILLIEDNPGDVRLIQEMVRKTFSRYYLISSIKTILNLSECPNII